ncbi:ShlB/FhaC/HecB family hemolysin secretion/activation protein [Pseudanabaena sp. FACHB-2040]|uniref:ShlB/FhaC/HecB family hemolysin secretion/activation protein n=1 Tax=Pseudanabaena sp. FACHB-2040 TaxID=2692859 RepID=UPI001682A151|nr:ShlB/FhaC/HecB family hemolysin secretion/activation protein [Pseudanabaena sp. FACHB-2040]MBD2256863.1 ShlB/FhaC/HecB family hemolysin secretion/activation protein [Pseudanabaena sp. FACHB-2040]
MIRASLGWVGAGGVLGFVGGLWGVALPAIAQQPPTLPPDLPDPVEQTLPPPSPPPVPIPSAPEPPILAPEVSPEGPPPAAAGPTFLVEQIEVLGSTVLQTEIGALVAPLEGQELTLADLLDLRTDITNLYINSGYITSGAFVPNNQDLSDGVVQIQVVEGALETVQINGLSRLREYYVRDRIALATQPPLNVDRLEEALQLLQNDPLLARVNAELTAGSGPGQNSLILDVAEADPFLTNLGVDNARAASIGSVQGTVAATHLNLLGFGDRLSAGYSYSQGLDLYEFRYGVPLNALDGTLQVRYENADSRIVDPRFVDIGIRSESETLSVNFRQPLTRSLSSEVALGLGLDLRESRSFILNNVPFSFSVGPEQGVAKVSALRFSQEWLTRDVNSVVAVRSQFSLGLNAFGATVNQSGTDGRFLAWLGQLQWVEQFAPGTLLLTRLNAQLTPDSLLPLERFSLGGIDTVRGYAQNQVVTDNAVVASVEFRFPLTANPNELQLAPFLDAGVGWNTQTINPDPNFLMGTGLGLLWRPAPEVNLRLDYGIPLVSVSNRGGSLQENGFYFSVNLQPF